MTPIRTSGSEWMDGVALLFLHIKHQMYRYVLPSSPALTFCGVSMANGLLGTPPPKEKAVLFPSADQMSASNLTAQLLLIGSPI